MMINNNNNTIMMTPILISTETTTTSVDMPTTSPSTPTATATAATTTVNRVEKPERNLWREQEMLTVLQIIREKKLLPLLNDKTVRSEAVFRKVEKEMFDRGYCKKNFQQIWTKWKFLKSTYMTSRRVHQIPKIIPLEVYESLDELLTAEFQNDGSMSSYDGGDYDDGGGCGNGGGGGGGGGGVSFNGSNGMMMMTGSSSAGYEMMNASASTTGSNDGYLPVISNVQGSCLPLTSASSAALASATSSTSSSNALFNGGRNYAADFNGFGGMRRNKFKNGFRSSFKNEEDTNGFAMQHPIFGYRLGVVKDEPVDNDYENNNNTTAEAEASFSDAHTEEPSNSDSQQFPDVIKPEMVSPPPSRTPSPSPSQLQEDDHLQSVPVIQSMAPHHSTPVESMVMEDVPLVDPHMPRLHRYTPPPFRPDSSPSDQQHPPPLKQIPFMKIQLPPKPQQQIPHLSQINHHHEIDSPINPIVYNKKIPVLTLRKRKKRLNIPELSEGTQSPAPSSKHSKISDEDDPKESPPETTRIPFVTYGKAMREMSTSLRDIQREMIDDFFKQQMDLAKSEHEFQKQQDAMLLRCFEDQTKLLLDGAKRMFASNQGVPMASDYFVNND